jgi:hypothetical protein
MQAAVLMILVAVAGIAFALWLATNILLEIGKGFRFVEKTLLDWWRKRQLEHHRQKQNAIEVAQNAAKEAEQQRIAAYRKTHPAQVVGAPDLQSLTKIVALLDEDLYQLTTKAFAIPAFPFLSLSSFPANVTIRTTDPSPLFGR